MATQIFLNLPVKSLVKTKAFFTALGFSFNQQFTDDKAACMVVDSNIYVMLLTEPFFQTFTKNAICDATKSTEVITALSLESRQAVDDMVNKAVAAGGNTPAEPQDHGWMYSRNFQDLDGHLWEVLYIDAGALPPQHT